MEVYLGWIYKKGQCTKFFFQVSTCLSNMFTHYIQNLEICNAFIISEPAGLHRGSTPGLGEVLLVTFVDWVKKKICDRCPNDGQTDDTIEIVICHTTN